MQEKSTLYEKAFNHLRKRIRDEKIRGEAVLSALVETMHQSAPTGLPNYWWIGVYKLEKTTSKETELKLVAGSSPACSALPVVPRIGGVCSDCALIEKPLIVPDTTRYVGHVTCDEKARSEMAVPLFNDEGKLAGVIDVDDVNYNSFDWSDAAWLSRIADLCSPHI